MSVMTMSRDSSLQALFNAGTCSSEDILRADFGHWPPRGLVVADIHKKPVTFRWIYTPLYAWETAKTACDKIKNDPAVPADLKKVPSWLMLPLLVGGMSVFGAVSFLRHLMGVGKLHGMVVNGDKNRRIYITPLSAPHRADTISREHAHILQGDRNIGKGKNILTPIFAAALKKEDEDGHYQLQDNEVQANLHVLMAHLYATHGIMPATKHEFLATFFSIPVVDILAGFEFYDFVRSEKIRDASNKLGLKKCDIEWGKGIAQEIAKDIVMFSCKLDTFAERRAYLTEALPALYADLVEMYGDPQSAATIRDEKIEDGDFGERITDLIARIEAEKNKPQPA